MSKVETAAADRVCSHSSVRFETVNIQPSTSSVSLPMPPFQRTVCTDCGAIRLATGEWKKTEREAPTALERLRHISSLTWNWDTYGAPPIGKNAIEIARRLIAVLAYDPQVVPTCAGGVQLEWHRDGLSVELTIPPEGATEFFASPDDEAER